MNQKQTRIIYVSFALVFFLVAPFAYIFFVEGRSPGFGTMIAALLVLYTGLITAYSVYQWRRRAFSTGMLTACGLSAVASFLLAVSITQGPESKAPGWVATRIILNLLLIAPSIATGWNLRNRSGTG